MIEVDKVWFDDVNYLLKVQKIKGMWDNINLADIRPGGPPVAARGLVEEMNEAAAMVRKVIVDKYGDYRMQQHYGLRTKTSTGWVRS